MRIVVIGCLVLLLSACAGSFRFPVKKGDPLRDNPRILFRDLTTVYHAPKKIDRNYGIIATRYAANNQRGFITEIQFANDSIIPSDVMLFTGLIKRALQDRGSRVVLVGHSHGRSAIGNGLLAIRRTRSVAAMLEKSHISANRIIQVATWSAHAKGRMSKVVRAYIVPSNTQWINVKENYV